ncbi:melatonin receptor type 1A-like [Acanthaster planci]|uniref:Melatonin receptor type 1A-like n=1 Tax=Acanthaster planci TaxID=133434 RepID=A0A8B7XJU9_ACAPL|nr:melatonin receptor type 1A-like [Acanthaster planci]
MTSSLALSFKASNATTASMTDELAEVYSYGELVFIGCTWTLVAVLGVVGNSLVILSVILSKLVQTSTNVLVVNLSVADLLTSLSLPWSSVVMLSDGASWPLSTEVPCQIAAFLFHTGLGASLYNLALIALNRLVRITRPLATYNRIFSPCKMAWIVTFAWLVPVIVVVFPPTIGVGNLGIDTKLPSCSDDELHPLAELYNLAQAIGFFPVPLITVIISYLAIYMYIRGHFKQLSTITNGDNPTPHPNSTEVPGEASDRASREEEYRSGRSQHRISQQQLTITKNLFVIFVTFMLCISPYFLSLFVPTSKRFTLYFATILILNSCVNPILYGAKHPQFRKVFRPMLRCRWERIPQPSEALKAMLARRQENNA